MIIKTNITISTYEMRTYRSTAQVRHCGWEIQRLWVVRRDAHFDRAGPLVH